MVNNLHTIVDGPPPSPDPDAPDETPPVERSWWRRWWWLVCVITATSLISAAVAAALIVTVPYVVESPGNLYTTADRISITGAQRYETVDKIDLVTVSLDTRVTWAEKFVADHTSDDVVLPAKDVLGTQTPSQNDALNKQLMTQSKDTAVLVALQRLGLAAANGATIQQVVDGSPAVGVLNVGETITAIDGNPVQSTDDLHAILQPHKPGDTVQLTLDQVGGGSRTASVTLGDNPQSPGSAFIGVAPTTRISIGSTNVDVSIASGSIGGPSAGLAFTLGILDLMTPGDLTGGKEVAVTGEIEPDGTVGEIGGVQSKVRTVEHGHVKYFIVPVGDADDAKAVAPPDVQIVPVHTLDEALAFLASLGGSGLPAGAPAPGT